jgi:hypothetical protein
LEQIDGEKFERCPRQGTLTPTLSQRERGKNAPILLRRERETERPEADAGEHAVLSAAELLQHGAGVGFVARFAEDESVAFGDSVGGKYDGRGLEAGGWGLRTLLLLKLSQHGGGLAKC